MQEMNRPQLLTLSSITLFLLTVMSMHINPPNEYWPFSSFGMYAFSSKKNLYTVEVIEENSAKKIDLLSQIGSYRFFYKNHILNILGKNDQEHDLDKESISQISTFTRHAIKLYDLPVDYVIVKIYYWEQFQHNLRNNPDKTHIINLNLAE
jgi:hypothetical protein